MADNNRERDDLSSMVQKSPALTALRDYFSSEVAWKDNSLVFGEAPKGQRGLLGHSHYPVHNKD